MSDTDWFRERMSPTAQCQHCAKPAPADNHVFVVHHIRYTPVMARVFICQKCHRNAHLFKKGYAVIWPLEKKPQGPGVDHDEEEARR